MSDFNPEFPPNAGGFTELGIEPDDDWLMTANPELQHEAMRVWFLSRYENPTNNTPYSTQEGGFMYIFGGPYDADDELTNRFGDVCPKEVIQAVIEDVESGGTIQWAPLHFTDYDTQFEYGTKTRGDAYVSFLQRLDESDELGAILLDEKNNEKLRQLLFGSLIGVLEAYLSETMLYWIAEDKSVFRRFVSTCVDFQKRKFPLSEILDRMDKLEAESRDYLQDLVWHRLDKVVPLMTSSLTITIPPIGTLMKYIVTRHDIVHRGGKTKKGESIVISTQVLIQLRSEVLSFVEAIESELNEQYPS